MNVSVETRSEVTRLLSIEVPEEAVLKEYEGVYARMARTAQVPGFRKGKVPRSILEPRLRASALQGAVEGLLPRVTREAVVQQALKAVGRPSIEDLKFDGTGPLAFKALVEVEPEFALGAVEGLGLSAPPAEVTEAEIDAQVRSLRERAARPGAAKEGPLAEGDWAKVDFQGFIEGQPFSGGQATDYALVLGRRNLIPGFEEQLVGAQAGETRSVKVAFPDDYPARDVAGKPAEFLVTVKEARHLDLPEADDAFARTFGPEVTDLAVLRERLREALAEQKARLRARHLMEAASEELLRTHRFTVPESLVEEEAEDLERGELGRLAEQGLELNGEGGQESLRKALREPAEKRARLALVLERIAQEKGIVVEDREFEAEVAALAARARTSPAEAARALRQSGREEGLRRQLRGRKALAWVVDKAKVSAAA